MASRLETVKLRCTELDRERWYGAAGGQRNFSDFARRALDAASAPTGVAELRAAATPDARRARGARAKPANVRVTPACERHSLAHCRVCKTGRYA